MKFLPSSFATRLTLLRCATLASQIAASHSFPFWLATSAATAATTTTTTTQRAAASSASIAAAQQVTVPVENVQAIQDLQPLAVWKHFSVLSSIPRPSKHEDAVLQYITSIAASKGLQWKRDNIGNLAVFVPGVGPHGTTAKPVIIQGHVDMVTEKNQKTVHDFLVDPILLERKVVSSNDKETWLTAKGTTLGADNGIGVAAALALLEEATAANDNGNDASVLDLPPLQLLFTIDEETGLTGAQHLDAQALGLTGKTLLNLDTEEWGELYVGCAGGGESVLTLDLQRQEAASESLSTLVELRVEGLLGGHSGVNIHEGRANAILLCAAATQAVLAMETEATLVSLTGGDKHNAIPREATAILSIPPDARTRVEEVVQQSLAAARAEYGLLETKLDIFVNDYDNDNAQEGACPAPLQADSARRLVALLLSLPHGPLKYSHAMKDLVETSNNVASVAISGNVATILCSSRSSVSSALEATRDRLTAVATLAGATIEKGEPYPGWNPNMKSPLLGIAQDILRKNLGRAPGVKAIHAGLECGLLIEKLGGDVDALSFGPTITGAHSPDESIHADTVSPFYQLVKDILGVLARQKATTTA